MIYEWYVKFKVGVDVNIIFDMIFFNLIFVGLVFMISFFIIIKDNIVKNVEYEIVCKVMNFFGESDEDIFLVICKNEVVLEVKLNLFGEIMSKLERCLICGMFLIF